MRTGCLILLLLMGTLFGMAQVQADTSGHLSQLKEKLLLPVDHFTKLINYDARRKMMQNKQVKGGYGFELTVQSDTTMQVKTPAAGKVESVFTMDGMIVVMINHGDYILGYSNLDVALVNKGDEVMAGQSLGMVINRSWDGMFELDVSMMDRTNKFLDPYPWFINSRYNKIEASL